jgi:5'-3' exonuclease
VHRPPEPGVRTAWDTNAVTPGTAFMERLCAALADRAAERAVERDGERTRRPRIEVSPSSEHGEGEQKIFEMLRLRARPVVGEGLAAVYGLDADLLLMAMSHPARDRIRVVREQDLGGALQVVDPAELARAVSDDMKRACGPGAGATDEDGRVYEFVALCGLLGNDFVPALPGARIRDGALDGVVGAYGRVLSARGADARLASGGPEALGGLDPAVLSDIAEALSRGETQALCDLERRHALAVEAHHAAVAQKQDDPDHPLQRPAAYVTRGGEPAWRLRYYRQLFLGCRSPDDVHAVCLQYATAVAWSAQYIGMQRCMSWGWHYAHAHAPTALDLHHALSWPSTHLAAAAERAFELADHEHAVGAAAAPSLEAWQLLLVLPPQSAALMRYARCREVVEDPRLGCSHMFPTGFRVCKYLRERPHECVPLLPTPDDRLLRAALVT